MRKHNVNVQKRKKHYTVGAILWPVSYTHLDVYKRQIHMGTGKISWIVLKPW